MALKSLCQQESKAKVAPFAGRGQGAERSTSSAAASKSRGINQGKVGVRQVPQALALVRLLLVRSGHHIAFYLFIACENGFGVSVNSWVSAGLLPSLQGL